MSETDSQNQNPDKMPEGRGEVIDFDKLQPVNDPDCVHEWVREEAVDIPGTHTELCQKCPIGRIVRD